MGFEWSTEKIPPVELIGMLSMKCIIKKGTCGQWLKPNGVSPSEFLYHMVHMIQQVANSAKAIELLSLAMFSST